MKKCALYFIKHVKQKTYYNSSNNPKPFVEDSKSNDTVPPNWRRRMKVFKKYYFSTTNMPQFNSLSDAPHRLCTYQIIFATINLASFVLKLNLSLNSIMNVLVLYYYKMYF